MELRKAKITSGEDSSSFRTTRSGQANAQLSQFNVEKSIAKDSRKRTQIGAASTHNVQTKGLMSRKRVQSGMLSKAESLGLMTVLKTKKDQKALKDIFSGKNDVYLRDDKLQTVVRIIVGIFLDKSKSSDDKNTAYMLISEWLHSGYFANTQKKSCFGCANEVDVELLLKAMKLFVDGALPKGSLPEQLSICRFFAGYDCDGRIFTRYDFDGREPMHIAAEYGCIDVVRDLHKSGVGVNIRSRLNRTPINYAVHNGQVEMVKVLKELGADLDTYDDSGMTAVYLAAENGDITMIKLLKGLGADIGNVINYRVPVIVAVNKNNIEMVKLLTKFGANIDEWDLGGNTAMHCAVANEDVAMVNVLHSLNADVNAKNDDGRTPMHFAVRLGNIAMVELLHTLGVKVNVRDNGHRAPIDYVEKQELVELLTKLAAQESEKKK